ncbi:MAG TPA: molecular chaperone DnaJ, partial [Clostridiales bacterium UBA8153]|nr:molecular chaperone DnaJ [Clostridiales bacterium UBA8153]
MSHIPDNIIIIHPDFEKLKAEVETLRTELSMFILERDNLLYQECKNIEMAYMLSVGALQYKAYENECAILRLKRKVELIQAKRNRQEKIILSIIEAILDAEFAEYKAKLDEQIRKMNEALERSKGERLTEAESRELKKLYRAIVKALHPDLDPDLSNERLKLFYNAVGAYELGDLEGLRIISTMVAEPAVPDEKAEGLVFLMKEKERLTRLIQSVKSGIDHIKSEYP